jgi:hypothetical protein
MYYLGEQFVMDMKKAVANDSCVLQGNKYRITVLTDRLVRLEILGKLDRLETLETLEKPQPLSYPENCTNTCSAFKPFTRARVPILYCAYFNIII